MFKGSKQIIPELSSEFLFIQSSVFVIVRIFDKIFLISVLFYELRDQLISSYHCIIFIYYSKFAKYWYKSIRLNFF